MKRYQIQKRENNTIFMDLVGLYNFYISLKNNFNKIKIFNKEDLTKDNNNKDKILTILMILLDFKVLVNHLVVVVFRWENLLLSVLNKFLITFSKKCIIYYCRGGFGGSFFNE